MVECSPNCIRPTPFSQPPPATKNRCKHRENTRARYGLSTWDKRRSRVFHFVLLLTTNIFVIFVIYKHAERKLHPSDKINARGIEWVSPENTFGICKNLPKSKSPRKKYLLSSYTLPHIYARMCAGGGGTGAGSYWKRSQDTSRKELK